jgi:hypothetical protein
VIFVQTIIFAVPPDELVEAHVLEVAAVSEVDKGSLVGNHAEEFSKQIRDAEGGRGWSDVEAWEKTFTVRVANPKPRRKLKIVRRSAIAGLER